MTTTFIFVRHGANDLISTHIAGRSPGLRLNDLGRAQAERVAAALGALPIEAVFAGPLERAYETAGPLCQRLNLELQTADEFTEINFGAWTNQRFDALNELPQWRRWNSLRSFSMTPGGETMLEVQARVVRKLLEIQTRYRFVVIFSHGDIIRATLAYFLGTPLDLFQRIQVDAASISVIEAGENHMRVRLLNGSPDPTVLERL